MLEVLPEVLRKLQQLAVIAMIAMAGPGSRPCRTTRRCDACATA